jgi:hypothetical protein
MRMKDGIPHNDDKTLRVVFLSFLIALNVTHPRPLSLSREGCLAIKVTLNSGSPSRYARGGQGVSRASEKGSLLSNESQSKSPERSRGFLCSTHQFNGISRISLLSSRFCLSIRSLPRNYDEWGLEKNPEIECR